MVGITNNFLKQPKLFVSLQIVYDHCEPYGDNLWV